MQSAITNVGRQFIVNNTTGGAWFSVTHFCLAWVNETELTNNPASATMTQLVLPDAGGNKANGDYIFNIWQTPFYYDGTGRQYGIGQNLSTGFGSYYRYDYDECNSRNTLTCYTAGLPTLPSGFATYGVTLNGASSSASTSSSGSDLTLLNIPAPLAYNTTTGTTYNTTTYSKYFPIKAFTTVESTDDTINALVSLMNYQLELPAVTTNTSDLAYSLQQAIGNFKFNRIGLYVTKSTYPDNIPQLITSLVPMADVEPVLFASIDLVDANTTCANTTLDVFKTRDDTGLSGFTMDAQISLSSVNSYPNFAGTASMYIDAVRDDATNAYLNQIEVQANTTEAIMQLQAQVIQLTQTIQSYLTGSSSTNINKKGFATISLLAPNGEYYIGNSQNNVYYFKGDYFRAYTSTTINNSNAIIDVLNGTQTTLNDGDEIKIIFDNLDGTSYTVGSSSQQLWTGNIQITNYDGITKDKIAYIDATLISGLVNAKVCVDLIYSLSNSCWVVSSVTAFDENKVLS